MPSAGGPVYQPTTVSNSHNHQRIGSDGACCRAVFWKRVRYISLLVFGLVSIVVGISLLASGTAAFVEAAKQAPGANSEIDQDEACWPVGITAAGVLMTIMGIVTLTIYFKKSDWRRDFACSWSWTLFDKKQSLARQLHSGGCGQGIMALNPSSDPLVSHPQYAPVSLPSLRAEDEERRNLMPDNKDCLSSAEESDRMLEPDPRIVLRPMGHVEDA